MILIGRLVYLMVFQSEYYTQKAKELHERERTIKAARGRIIDANGEILADNRTVCTCLQAAPRLHVLPFPRLLP